VQKVNLVPWDDVEIWEKLENEEVQVKKDQLVKADLLDHQEEMDKLDQREALAALDHKEQEAHWDQEELQVHQDLMDPLV
jgi:hypothetical protein